jgi:hypothetical protein
MSQLVDSPFAVFAIALAAQSAAAYGGMRLRRALRPLASGEQEDFDTVLTAS